MTLVTPPENVRCLETLAHNRNFPPFNISAWRVICTWKEL